MFESLCRYTLEQYEYGFMMQDNERNEVKIYG